jgi:hypothetical protein
MWFSKQQVDLWFFTDIAEKSRNTDSIKAYFQAMSICHAGKASWDICESALTRGSTKLKKRTLKKFMGSVKFIRRCEAARLWVKLLYPIDKMVKKKGDKMKLFVDAVN